MDGDVKGGGAAKVGAETGAKTGAKPAPAEHDVAALLEDLHQHQQELEAQNEELRSKQALAEQATRRFTALFQNLPLPAFVIDDVGIILDSNELAEAQFELGRVNLRSHFFPRFLPAAGQRKLRHALVEARRSGTVEITQLALAVPAGNTLTVDLQVARLDDDAATTDRYAVLIVDQTGLSNERDRAEQARVEAVRLNRAYAMLSHCNRLIIKAQDDAQLCADLCQLLVRFGGYGRAAIVAETVTGLHTLASHGDRDDTLLDAGPLPAEVIDEAQRSQRSVVIDDLALRETSEGWQNAALRAGLRTLAAFPLDIGTVDSRGALLLWGRAPGAMESAERELLEQLAHDLAWGLQGLRLRQSIIDAERRLDAVLASGDTVLWEWERAPAALRFDHRWPGFPVASQAARAAPLTGWDKLLAPSDQARLEAAAGALDAVPAGHTFQLEHELQLADGSVAWVLNRGRVIQRDEQGGLLHAVGTLVDISAQHRAESDLRLAASVFENTGEGIVIADVEGRIIRANETIVGIIGHSREELLGSDLTRLITAAKTGTGAKASEPLLETLRRDGCWSGEVSGLRPGGSNFSTLVSISTVRDEEQQPLHYVAFFADIVKLKEQQARLKFLAQHDALTGLPNRVLLSDRLEQAMALARRQERLLAIAFLDLDDFKPVNDRFGHHIGDQLLQTIARRITSTLRDSDTVARLGGDEFALVLTDIASSAACDKLINRLLEEARRPIVIDGHELQVAASIGLRYYRSDDYGTDAEQLLRQADQAMYQAKERGRNRYHVFDPVNARSSQARHKELGRLRKALEQNELLLLYQPQVDMFSGELLGVEALLRWLHPERGQLAPGAFMPLVESDDLAIDYGQWVIREALRQHGKWLADGRCIPMSVNVSPRHLQQPGFIDDLQTQIREAGLLQPGNLKLELLESSALEDIEAVSATIARCRALGVGFALDDFGTGFSTLSYLKRISASQLKIDQSFVRNMERDPDDLLILEGVLAMAKAFRKNVIAEGVETEEHGRMLLQLGCRAGQGYAIARPMAPEALAAWQQSWRPPASWPDCVELSEAQRELLRASVEHRAWHLAVEQYLQGAADSPPELNPELCRVHQTLAPLADTVDGAAASRMRELSALHEHVHSSAAALVTQYQRGGGHSHASLNEFSALCAELSGQLSELLQPTAASTAPGRRRGG